MGERREVKLSLWNDHLPDYDGQEVIDVVIFRLSVAQCTDEWANSEEGRSSLANLITEVNSPKAHEIKRVMTKEEGSFKRFRLFIERDPCPVLFLGGKVCPLCGGTHGA